MSSIEDTHNEILRSLGRLEGKVDGILEQATKTNGRVNKLEEVTTTLKVQNGVTSTKMGIIGAVAGTIMAGIVSLFFQK